MKNVEELIEVWDFLLKSPKAHADRTPYGVHTLESKTENVRIDLSCEPDLSIEPAAGHLSFRGQTFDLDSEQVLKLRSQFHEKKDKALDDLKEVLK